MSETAAGRDDRDPAAYAFTLDVPTRWGDQDAYGHVNNAVHYRLFENVIMVWLEREHGLDTARGDVRCFTVENGCRYHAPLHHPDVVRCALRTGRIGSSSVRYELALFGSGESEALATGFVVDVFVDAATERPTPIPVAFRTALEALQTTD